MSAAGAGGRPDDERDVQLLLVERRMKESSVLRKSLAVVGDENDRCSARKPRLPDLAPGPTDLVVEKRSLAEDSMAGSTSEHAGSDTGAGT
jgi:hypothetical protein